MENFLSMMAQHIVRIAILLIGAVVSYCLPVKDMVIVYALLVALDVLTAVRLSRRMRRKGLSDGKIQSRGLGKALGTIFVGFLFIVLSYHTQQVVMATNIYLHNIIASAMCGWQILSAIENESSYNGAGWALFLQKYLIDKSSRHLGFDVIKAYRETKEEAIDNPATPAPGRPSAPSGGKPRPRERSDREQLSDEHIKEEMV